MTETEWCYGVTFQSSYPVEPVRGEAVMQVAKGHSGMPSVHIQLLELAKSVGSCVVFLTRTQHKRITLADSSI